MAFDQSQIQFVSPFQLKLLQSNVDHADVSIDMFKDTTQDPVHGINRMQSVVVYDDGIYEYSLYMWNHNPDYKPTFSLLSASGSSRFLTVVSGELAQVNDASLFPNWGGSMAAFIANVIASKPDSGLATWFSSLSKPDAQNRFYLQDNALGARPAYFDANSKINYLYGFSFNYWIVGINKAIVETGEDRIVFNVDRPFIPLKSFKSADLVSDTFVYGKPTFQTINNLSPIHQFLQLGMNVGLNDFILQPQQFSLSGASSLDDRLLIYEQL